jgi:hypothetical protein
VYGGGGQVLVSAIAQLCCLRFFAFSLLELKIKSTLIAERKATEITKKNFNTMFNLLKPTGHVMHQPV